MNKATIEMIWHIAVIDAELFEKAARLGMLEDAKKWLAQTICELRAVCGRR